MARETLLNGVSYLRDGGTQATCQAEGDINAVAPLYVAAKVYAYFKPLQKGRKSYQGGGRIQARYGFSIQGHPRGTGPRKRSRDRRITRGEGGEQGGGIDRV